MTVYNLAESLRETSFKRDSKFFVLTGLIVLVFMLGSFNSVSAIAVSVTWDHPKYYLNHGFIVMIDDSLDTDFNKNNNVAQGYMTVNLKSLGLAQIHSYQIPYTGSGYIFKSQSYINFTTVASDATHFQTSTSDPAGAADTIELWYGGSKQSITTVQGNDDNKLTSDSATTPQPNYSTKLTCATGDGPSNGDGICDSWKTTTPGYLTIPLGGNTYFFPCPVGDTCNDTTKKDLYVEVDAMQDQMPPQAAFDAIKTVFLNANPSIRLHFIIDEEFPRHSLTAAQISTPPAISEFEWYKHMYFGTSSERNAPNCTGPSCNVSDELTAKRQIFHYMLFINRQAGNQYSTGYSERPGNDMEVSLGTLSGGYGSLDDIEGTAMHELGHNLGLYHGGYTSDLNCKPNYPSVMSYSRQLSTFFARPLDYSYGLATTLTQGSLSESAGIGGTGMTVFGPSTPMVNATGAPVNYDWGTDHDTTDTGMTQMLYKIPSVGCTTSTSYNMPDSADWSHLIFAFKSYNSFGSGVGGNDSEGTDSDNSEIVVGEIPTSYAQSQGPSVQQVRSHMPNHSLIREIDYKADQQAEVYNQHQKKIDPTSTISDAKDVIANIKSAVDVEFTDAVTDFNNIISDQENDIKSAKTLAKLNKIKTDVLGNLTNAHADAVQNLDNVFSDNYKVKKIQLIQNASWTVDEGFANGIASIDYYLNDIGEGIVYDNAKEDLKQQLLDSRSDVDKQIITGRDDGAFQTFMYTHPDNSTFPIEITLSEITGGRLSLVDALNATIQNESLIYDDKNSLNKDLNDVKNFISDGYLTDASETLNETYTKINSAQIPESGDYQENLHYKKMALGEINNMIVTLQIATKPLPSDKQYSAPIAQLIADWLLLLFIAIIAIIAVYAIITQLRKKKSDKRHDEHMRTHHGK